MVQQLGSYPSQFPLILIWELATWGFRLQCCGLLSPCSWAPWEHRALWTAPQAPRWWLWPCHLCCSSLRPWLSPCPPLESSPYPRATPAPLWLLSLLSASPYDPPCSQECCLASFLFSLFSPSHFALCHLVLWWLWCCKNSSFFNIVNIKINMTFLCSRKTAQALEWGENSFTNPYLLRAPFPLLVVSLAAAMLALFTSFVAESDLFLTLSAKINSTQAKDQHRIRTLLTVTCIIRRISMWKKKSTAGRECNQAWWKIH